MIRKILGPPGTGKTTKLLKYVNTFYRLGTPLNKIGYFAFTTKAANEAKDRMLDLHSELQSKDLPYFKTLHALCFAKLGLKKSNVMQPEHYEDIGKKLGIEVTVFSDGEEKTGFVDSDSEYFNIINAARIKEISVEEEYNTDMYSENIDKRQLKILRDEVDSYKSAYKLVDFTDMIFNFNASELCPKFDVVIIDEAQDLSPIQWKMFDILKQNSKHVILAGDDDQAIYGWAGADVHKFQDEKAKDIVLPQSYRVPKAVQNIANTILQQIPDDRKLSKMWQPRSEEGSVQRVTSLDDVPLEQGTWLVLGRTHSKLQSLKEPLCERGIYYEYKNRRSYNERLFRNILNYERWRDDTLLSLTECRDLFEFFNKEFTHVEERLYDLKEFGYSITERWYEVFETHPEESLYIRLMRQNGEELSKAPRVKLSTIHAAKGGEADNVLLILDNTKKIRESFEKNEDKRDEEHRVWYVGVTRTKQNLYIMEAKKERNGYEIETI